MEELKRRILSDGQNLGRGILKVDGFINHKIDTGLMKRCGEELAKAFEFSRASLVLTAEISGIAPAFALATALGIPVVYARKTRPVTMIAATVERGIPSRTKGGTTDLYVSGEAVGPTDRVIVVDDFLASGQTLSALARIVDRMGAKVVGFGSLVEKRFEGGRSVLERWDVPVLSLAVITSLEDDQILCE